METGRLQVSVSRTQLHTFSLIYSTDLPSTFWRQDFLSLPKTISLSLSFSALALQSCRLSPVHDPVMNFCPGHHWIKKIPLLKHSGVLVHHSQWCSEGNSACFRNAKTKILMDTEGVLLVWLWQKLLFDPFIKLPAAAISRLMKI